MAATLLTTDRSSAGAEAAIDTAVSDPGEPSRRTEAVFRMVADGRSHTLDEIGLTVGVSASTVADEIDRLRRYGMAIEETADTVVGTPIVPLDLEALNRALAAGGNRSDSPPWETEVVFATQSTNSDLLAAVRAARLPIAPIVRVAELQLAGRGRLGRRWSSAPGASLTASFALIVGRRLSQLDGATLVCGLAVHAVLEDFGVEARLKWPNDVLVDGDKLAGILVEAHAAGESSVLVIGIGLNVAETNEDATSSSLGGLRRTTLAAAGNHGVDRNLLAARLARSLEAHMAKFEKDGFGSAVDRWNAVDAFADRCVTLGEPGARKNGIARGVDDRGALLVDIDGRRQRIVAGDVSLRPVDEAPA